MKTLLPIAVTMGDPTGIGPEISVKILSKYNLPIVLYGNLKILQNISKKLGLEFPENKVINTSLIADKEIDRLVFGQPTKLSGQISYSAIELAVNDCIRKKTQAVVTGPISKLALNLAGHKWPGHTELLSYLSNPIKPPNVRMTLLSDKLLIVLNSVHLPLKNVITELSTEKLLQTLAIANKWSSENKIIDPHFWMSALNPHAGESGMLGSEEDEIIKPAIRIARERNINISGPWPADTLFMKVKKLPKAFPPNNIIISLYHDQALIPFKLDGLDNGVNLTAGLPFLRTSVDHGTAFDIAGKGIASEVPLKNAILKTQELIFHNKTNG